MWLPIDERRLLTAYFHSIGDIGEQHRKSFRMEDICPKLSCCASRSPIAEYGDHPKANVARDDVESMKREMRAYISSTRRIELANRHLAERGLIACAAHQHESVVTIGLTLAGYDLGRQYANWFDLTGCWWEHRRDHWLWLIVSFVLGIGATIVTEYILWLIKSE